MVQHLTHEAEEPAPGMVVYVTGMIPYMKNTDNMNKEIFEKKPLIKKSLFQRWFKQEPDENCVIEINNLFADKPIESVSVHDMELIVSKYGTAVYKSFGLNMEEFYITYINECCKNGIISEFELDNIKHLQSLLLIADNTTIYYRQKLGIDVIDREYIKLLKNPLLDNNEFTHFNKLVQFFDISDTILKGIKDKRNTQFVDSLAKPFIAKKRVSYREFQELEQSLNIRNINLPAHSKQMLNKFLSYWKLEKEPLQQWGTNQEIIKSEICLYEESNINWFELRSERGCSSYQFIKRGTIVMTNKKMYFFASDSSSKLAYTQIANVLALPDQVLIKKYRGKEPKLVSKKDQVIFEIMLKKIWNAHLSQNWPS
ncbi:hypothetical protein OHD16_05930 [Sphingobacterium sp. ML3W]|uniref:hypothetical protein n=1 Tax=Sphingobacterium sp. ML3W TaxID=1538644 RepID=UPI00249B9EB9|nr:hypothetical protein [Sphingobacterium sp. ML3W]WFA79506.1 hypothetical protein OGI71_26175 [Sphingobacterium sp. ML3W]